ncbi:hypothetical protein [Photorhabdus sp. CRCIA-P01]|uniref:hypothetical protein n=1 Tax=Photorhabdus sp. CRCIA-P01 TaxID=2019570 RepID=UPI000E5A0088|nr:hypothetical protein [Photorhabdus sp. CRCIA-P01]
MSENKKHVHAELMLQYAQDALKTDEPWKMWEYRDKDGDYICEWKELNYTPKWGLCREYRRKTEITVGKVSFPKPVDYELNNGDKYYSIIDSMSYDECGPLIWFGDNIDVLYLNNRCIHLTEEAAKQHVEALIKINKGEF